MTELPPHDHAPAAQSAGEVPGATASMVLGIVSIILALSCSLAGLIVGLIGMQKSKHAKAFIDANPGNYVNESNANIGYTCSIIGVILSAVFIVLGLLWVIFAVLLAAAGAAA